MKFSYVVTPQNIVFTLDEVVYNVKRNSEMGTRLLKQLNKHKETGVMDIEEVKDVLYSRKIKSYISQKCEKTGITITEDDCVLLDGEPLSQELGDVIKKHYYADIDFEYLVNFIHKLRQNPSYRVREQLYKFIRASLNDGGFTISHDGDIMAYKRVRKDYKDIHSGTFDNSPGKIVEMERRDVNDDPSETCSSGLHFCAYSYLKYYRCERGDRIVLVKINPADVVSIPYDCGNAKGRCCKYYVVCEVQKPVDELVFDV